VPLSLSSFHGVGVSWYNERNFRRREKMAVLSDEAKRMIREMSPAVVGTASKDGTPNLSLKGSFRVLDDEHVAFADIASPQTVANIRENPRVAAIVFDASQRKGCRIWGSAEILTEGDLFNSMKEEFARRGMEVKHVIKVKVERVKML